MPGETASHDASAIRLGDIFVVSWDPGRGSEQTGSRPALVVQNDAFNLNARYPNTIVVTISKSGRDIPTHVKLLQTPENGLREQLSYVKCEQLFTIAKIRLGRKLGRITNEQLADVSRALKRVLSIS